MSKMIVSDKPLLGGRQKEQSDDQTHRPGPPPSAAAHREHSTAAADRAGAVSSPTQAETLAVLEAVSSEPCTASRGTLPAPLHTAPPIYQKGPVLEHVFPVQVFVVFLGN